MSRIRDIASILTTASNLATDTETTAAITAHNSATTSVHGITNTADLATQTYVQLNKGVQSGTSIQRPTSFLSSNGDVYSNTTTGYLEVYSSTYGWEKVGANPSNLTVTPTNLGTARAYNDGGVELDLGFPSVPGRSYVVTSTPSSSTTTVTTPYAIITGLQSSTQYTFTATATNLYGSSTPTTSSPITVTTVPQAPTIGTATAVGSTTAYVTWTAGATGGSAITAYTVHKFSGSTLIDSTNVGTTPSANISVNTGTAYTFKVSAANANGMSELSAASNSITATELLPPQTNLFAWYDSSDASSITLSGSNVTQWNDKSGNTRHATQSTASFQPTIVSSGLNGKNTILFDGTNDMFNIANTTTLANNFAVFAVVKSNFLNSISGSAIIGSDDGGVSWYVQKNNYRVNVDKTNQASMLVDGNILSTSENNIWRQTSFLWSGTSSGTVRWNKGSMGSFNRAGFFPTAPIKTIGAYMPGDTGYLAKGEMAEILIYNSSSVDVAAVESYFTTKWGV